jgi:hypothetical protein
MAVATAVEFSITEFIASPEKSETFLMEFSEEPWTVRDDQ